MQGVPLPLSQEWKTFSENYIACSQSPENFVYFEKKGQVYNLDISEVIDAEKYGYLNARKFLFKNTLRESRCSRVLNIGETTMGALLSQFFIDPRHTEFENISVSEI